MDDLILGFGRIVRNPVQKTRHQPGIQAFYQFTGPNLCVDAFKSGACRHEVTKYNRNNRSRHHSIGRVYPRHACQSHSHEDIEQHATNKFNHFLTFLN